MKILKLDSMGENLSFPVSALVWDTMLKQEEKIIASGEKYFIFLWTTTKGDS
jgi:hypothetical protein